MELLRFSETALFLSRFHRSVLALIIDSKMRFLLETAGQNGESLVILGFFGVF